MLSGRYTDRIKLLTLQNPFPMPTLRPWNGSNCGAAQVPPRAGSPGAPGGPPA